MSDGEVLIEYGVERTGGGGYLPVLRTRSLRYFPYRGSAPGYSRDVALELAKAKAEEEVSRYAGDWSITVRETEF